MAEFDPDSINPRFALHRRGDHTSKYLGLQCTFCIVTTYNLERTSNS